MGERRDVGLGERVSVESGHWTVEGGCDGRQIGPLFLALSSLGTGPSANKPLSQTRRSNHAVQPKHCFDSAVPRYSVARSKTPTENRVRPRALNMRKRDCAAIAVLRFVSTMFRGSWRYF